MNVIERFWSKVDAGSDDECWPWLGSLSDGYGQFYVDGRRTGAHRFSSELADGPIPEGLIADHTCHDPATCPGGACVHRRCVNPRHIARVTRADNRAAERTASPERRRTHCSNGHEFTEANTYRYGNRRQCRTCHSARSSRRAGNRKAASA